LEEEECADVTFSVGGETFTAHKLVLAMRSPVFKAEFYGPMRERSAQLVTIEE
jgi:speckle-type POZ protein